MLLPGKAIFMILRVWTREVLVSRLLFMAIIVSYSCSPTCKDKHPIDIYRSDCDKTKNITLNIDNGAFDHQEQRDSSGCLAPAKLITTS
jgi:hypothetical protein